MKYLLWILLLVSSNLFAKTTIRVESNKIEASTNQRAIVNALQDCISPKKISSFRFFLFRKNDSPGKCGVWSEIASSDADSPTVQFNLTLEEGQYFVVTKFLELVKCSGSDILKGEYKSETSEVINIEESKSKISDVNAPIFLVYPNPTEGIMSVKSLVDIKSADIEIYNQRMESILTKKYFFKEDYFSCNLSHLENGIYFLKVKANDKTEIIKFIKQ